MPTNENTYNSRVTSEALEAKFRQVFPSQGGAELVDDLYASGVIQPVIDFSQVAEGSILPPNLQTAWDFATGFVTVAATSPQTVISNPGFWQIDLVFSGYVSVVSAGTYINGIDIWDGATSKPVWEMNTATGAGNDFSGALEDKFVVFLRSGDALRARTWSTTGTKLNIWYRQIADVNGTLVNPLGFTFS